ncbi:hypothetical protein F4806DRAFT_126285 [Annulohypoxylon nitens]|nr:hypothetical protein F4806DRAFT_126285 [Annulohypoxylon nitens]
MEDKTLTETRGPMLYKLGIVMAILPTLAIILRFWARLITSKMSVWWDDWLALLAWCCCMVNCAFTIRGVQLGLGKHFEAYTSKSDVSELLELLYFSEIVFELGIFFAKSSVLLFYRRVFSSRSRNFNIAYYITFGLVAVFILYKLPAQILACVPPEKYWHSEIEGTCQNNYTNFGLLLTGLLLDVITDLMILLLPMKLLSHLQISRKKMIALLGAFATGYITWVTSIGRLGAYISVKPYLGDPDISWYQIPDLAWSLAEISVSVLSICIPSWFYLFKRLSQGGVASLFRTRDISVSTGEDDRGASSNRRINGYQQSSADGSLSQSGWRNDSGSIAEAPLIHLANISNSRKVETDSTVATTMPAGPNQIYVTNDVILSYKNNEQDRKGNSNPYEVV